MLRKEVKYTNYNGEADMDVCYFNLTKAELGKLQMHMDGKFLDHLQLLVEGKHIESLYDFFYNLLLDSYGEKDATGKKFIKNAQIREDFENSIAFSELLMQTISSAEAMSSFVRQILPPDMMTAAGDVDAKVIPATT